MSLVEIKKEMSQLFIGNQKPGEYNTIVDRLRNVISTDRNIYVKKSSQQDVKDAQQIMYDILTVLAEQYYNGSQRNLSEEEMIEYFGKHVTLEPEELYNFYVGQMVDFYVKTINEAAVMFF